MYLQPGYMMKPVEMTSVKRRRFGEKDYRQQSEGLMVTRSKVKGVVFCASISNSECKHVLRPEFNVSINSRKYSCFWSFQRLCVWSEDSRKSLNTQ